MVLSVLCAVRVPSLIAHEPEQGACPSDLPQTALIANICLLEQNATRRFKVEMNDSSQVYNQSYEKGHHWFVPLAPT